MRVVLIFLFNLWQELSVQSLRLGCSFGAGGGAGKRTGTGFVDVPVVVVVVGRTCSCIVLHV